MNITEVLKKAKFPNVVFLTPHSSAAKSLKTKLLLKTDDLTGRVFSIEGKTVSVISLNEDTFSEIPDYALMYVAWIHDEKHSEEALDKLKNWERRAKQILSL